VPLAANKIDVVSSNGLLADEFEAVELTAAKACPHRELCRRERAKQQSRTLNAVLILAPQRPDPSPRPSPRKRGEGVTLAPFGAGQPAVYRRFGPPEPTRCKAWPVGCGRRLVRRPMPTEVNDPSRRQREPSITPTDGFLTLSPAGRGRGKGEGG